jgi:hypothetical protein
VEYAIVLFFIIGIASYMKRENRKQFEPPKWALRRMPTDEELGYPKTQKERDRALLLWEYPYIDKTKTLEEIKKELKIKPILKTRLDYVGD